MTKLRGGCYCEAIRYEIDSVFDAVYCHCTICRRFTGSPVFAGLITPRTDFRLVAGEPASFASSEHGTRWFCQRCGTQIYCTDNRNDYISVGLGTLNDPEAVEPAIHMWTESALPWFHVEDDLLRVAAGTLPHPEKRGRVR